MMRSLQLFYLSAFLFFSLFFGFQGNAQQNANKDQLPKGTNLIQPDTTDDAAAVVTIGDFDNFHIGTDYAETHITQNPNNPLQNYAAWNASGSAGGSAYKTLNGFDWSASNPAWGTTGMGDIVLAYDSIGTLYYENMYGSSSVQGCKVAVSSDNGVTWTTPVNAIAGSDKNWITADQTGGPYSNYVYTTMTGTTSGQGVFCRSTDHGVTWQQTATFGTQSLPGMMSCVGPNGDIQGGSVYVVTNSGTTTASTYTFYQSTNGGQSFTMKSSQNFAGTVGNYVNSRHSVENMRTRPYPFIACDNSHGPHRGRLYNVYTSNTPAGSGNKPDIFCRYSDDSGVTWSAATVVNDDANTTANHNFFPALWCDKTTGRLYIQWLDTRDTPTSDSAMVYASFSDDGGVTFAPNQAVSNAKMKLNCTQCPGSGTPKYQGDYNGIASNPNGAILSWTDFRNGTFANYIGYFPDFAMRLTPTLDTIIDSAVINVVIPAIKLYTDTVVITASIAATPNNFVISFPNGNKIWNYPGSIPIVVKTSAPMTTGNYQMTVWGTGTNGTPVHKRTATIHINPSIVPVANFNASQTVICSNQNISFTDQSTGNPTSWHWTFENATPSTSTQQNPGNIHFNGAGTFDVKLVASNPLGSDSITKTDFITVTDVSVSPVVNSQTVCHGAPIPALTAVGTDLKWYNNQNLSVLLGTGSNYVPTVVQPGVYTYYVTQNTNGCASQPTPVTLTINASPQFALPNDTLLCANYSITLNATAAGAQSYLWTPGNLTTPTIHVDTTGLGMGAFTFVALVTGSNGCFKRDTVTLTFTECAGIDDLAHQLNVQLYPNPGSGLFTLEFKGIVNNSLNVRIYNSIGAEVFKLEDLNFNGIFKKSLNLENLSDGIYLLSVERGNDQVQKRFVIKK